MLGQMPLQRDICRLWFFGAMPFSTALQRGNSFRMSIQRVQVCLYHLLPCLVIIITTGRGIKRIWNFGTLCVYPPQLAHLSPLS